MITLQLQTNRSSLKVALETGGFLYRSEYKKVCTVFDSLYNWKVCVRFYIKTDDFILIVHFDGYFHLLHVELHQNDCWKMFLKYRKVLRKREDGSSNNCSKANIMWFLKFCILNNGCFDDQLVHEFQLRLLKKVVDRVKHDRKLKR